MSRKPNFKRLRYNELMRAMTLEADEYMLLKRAFQGGFTHANPFFTDVTVEDVTSFDFTSSYPAAMVAEQFPISKGYETAITDKDQFADYLEHYCCVFDIRFTDLESVVLFDNYISESRCWQQDRVFSENGRVVSAKMISTTITGEDYRIIRRMYTWSKCEIGRFYYYYKGYLPRDFVAAILKLYSDKTTLKGVIGKEAEYMNSKEMLNACYYGMTVTDIIRNDHPYIGDEWKDPETPDLATELEKYNNSRSRFLFYPWGVWVTAYARRNLFSGIFACGEDYIYSDTDSIKIRNADKHRDYFEDYNRTITRQLQYACDFHHFEYDTIAPKTIQGVEKPLGVWDFDGHYKRFKTLGAKRYLTETDDGELHLTVAGLNKKVVTPYLREKYGDKVFENFTNLLTIPKGKTGKMTHTYIDESLDGVVTDYLGNVGEFHERSVVHLEDSEHRLSMSQSYIDYFLSIQQEDL